MITVGVGKEGPRMNDLLSNFASEEDGALLLFLGVVRNQSGGRGVEGLEYEAYEEMAEEVLGAIAREAGEEFGTDRIFIHHRTGLLEVGEVSTVIAVATPHRDEAYRASRTILEEIKKRLPVWKKEKYLEGGSEWVKGHVPEAPRDAVDE